MVRSRYAPSPTGSMHVGNLRSALFEYLIAKNNNGTFILRIEDTDRKRYVEGSIDIIYNTLKTVGIVHDEGPDIGGPYGPYVQSERLGIYIEHAKQLIALGGAYYCFCSKERLDGIENYDRLCLNLPEDEITKKLDSKTPYVVRQFIPEGKTTFKDEVYGQITVENTELDDQILIKSDGFPTYNFANVVDDHLMEITHVVRGSEFLSSTPKYTLLYEQFGWQTPAFIHLPLFINDDGTKMAKRKGDMSFNALLEEGYLPEAVINFIALLGWSPPDNREIFTLPELIEAFEIKNISKAPSKFDFVKLAWMNGEYIKNMPKDKFFELALPYIKEGVKRQDVNYEKIANIVQTRINFFKEIPGLLDFIDMLPEYDAELYVHKKMKTDKENSLPALKEAKMLFEGIAEWTEENIYNKCMSLVEKLGIKNGQLFWPVRTALSGKESSPCGAAELAALLGKEESLKRIETGIEKLSGF